MAKLKRLKSSKISLRDRAKHAASKTTAKPKRIFKQSVQGIRRPISAASRIGKKEFYLKTPDTRFWRFMNQRRKFWPKFFKLAWQELRQVVWPSRRETIKLTLAVFAFSFVFGIVIALTDYGLDKLFRKLILE